PRAQGGEEPPALRPPAPGDDGGGGPAAGRAGGHHVPALRVARGHAGPRGQRVLRRAGADGARAGRSHLMASVLSVTFDCDDPIRLAAFWREALRYELEEQDPDGTSIRDTVGIGPVLYFQRVPEAKTVKNRVHLDVRAEDTM